MSLVRSYSSQKVKWVFERLSFVTDIDGDFGLTDNNDGGGGGGGGTDERRKVDCFTDVGERGATIFNWNSILFSWEKQDETNLMV